MYHTLDSQIQTLVCTHIHSRHGSPNKTRRTAASRPLSCPLTSSCGPAGRGCLQSAADTAPIAPPGQGWDTGHRAQAVGPVLREMKEAFRAADAYQNVAFKTVPIRVCLCVFVRAFHARVRVAGHADTFCSTLLASLKSGIRFLSQPTMQGLNSQTIAFSLTFCDAGACCLAVTSSRYCAGHSRHPSTPTARHRYSYSTPRTRR